MPGPFSALSKIEKADIGKQLEETIEVDGRIIKKGDLLEFEIEKGLGFGKSQEDIMKKLKQQGVDVAPNYVKERMKVARTRKPIRGDRPDPRYAKMEANYIIQREMNAGKTWEEISNTLLQSGFNGPKLTEVARANHTKKMQQQSPPAVIDNGESGPMAPWDQPPVFNPEAEARAANAQVMNDRKMSIEEKLQDLLETARAAGRKKSADLKGLRAEGAEEASNSPFVRELERLAKMFTENKIPEGARFMDSNNPTNNQASLPQNLDVPLAQAGINGPVEPEFRNR
jgi:hypothetical protein